MSICYGNIYSQPLEQPTVFEPGIISTGDYDTHPAFSPSGDTLFFMKCAPDFSSWTICVSYKQNGSWSDPQIAIFSGQYMDADPFFTKDGKTLYFISDRPVDESDSNKTDLDIWKVIKTKSGWSDPIHLDPPISSDKDEFYPTFTEDGIMYFGSKRDGGIGSADIYRASLIDGEYQLVKNLGDSINTEYHEYEPFISPDERFLIFMAARPNALAYADLYVSYRNEDQWSKAEKIPFPYSSTGMEFSPKITWDGKYFIFASTRNTFMRPSEGAETTEEFNVRIRSPGNGLGDIYVINSSAFYEAIGIDIR